MSLELELRAGTRVRYHPGEEPGAWREGTLVRASANGEEWLVRNEFGRFWLSLARLFPVGEPEAT